MALTPFLSEVGRKTVDFIEDKMAAKMYVIYCILVNLDSSNFPVGKWEFKSLRGCLGVSLSFTLKGLIQVLQPAFYIQSLVELWVFKG